MKRSLRIRILASLVAAAFAFWWFKTPPPNVGGGQGDDLLAPWVKSRVYATVNPNDEKGFTRLTSEDADGWYHVVRERIQSFDYYRDSKPSRPTAQRRVIVLQPIGPFTPDQKRLLPELKEFCAAFFQLPVRIAESIPLPGNEVPSRMGGLARQGRVAKQYDAEQMLSQVLTPRLPNDAVAYLGITMADLWASQLSFVFGLGSSESRTGIYSLTRYFPSSKVALSDQERRQGLRRSCQILGHEMGHMLGLSHCVLYKCAMNGCNSLEDADVTPLDYCPVCHRKLLWNLGANGTERYQALAEFYRQHGLRKKRHGQQPDSKIGIRLLMLSNECVMNADEKSLFRRFS